MKTLAWLRQPGRWDWVLARLLLVLATLWGLFRTARSVRMLFPESHDFSIYYSLWFLLWHREFADIALSQALYLPHTWLVLTPLFLLGWPAAKTLMLLLNVASVLYIWARLSHLADLQGVRRWLLLAFLWSWLGTGLVVGLGNLALVCVAALLAAYPFTSTTNGLWLALSAMKHSLVFPVYLQLLLKRPRSLIAPALVILLSGVAALVWAGLSPADLLSMARGSASTLAAWTAYDLTSLRRLLRPLLGSGLVLTVVVWSLWMALYVTVLWRIKDRLVLLAALLLLSLLPLYHQQYDLVAAAPALALFLKRGSLAWPAGLTLLLAGNVASFPSDRLPAGLRQGVEVLAAVYLPLLVLACLGRLLWIERDLASQARGFQQE